MRKEKQQIQHKIVTAIIEVYMANCVVKKLNQRKGGRCIDGEKNTPDQVRTGEEKREELGRRKEMR